MGHLIVLEDEYIDEGIDPEKDLLGGQGSLSP